MVLLDFLDFRFPIQNVRAQVSFVSCLSQAAQQQPRLNQGVFSMWGSKSMWNKCLYPGENPFCNAMGTYRDFCSQEAQRSTS